MIRGILAFVVAMVSATGAMAQDIGGQYAVAGQALDGSVYTGEAVITFSDPTICTIEWTTTAGDFTGTCIRTASAMAADFSAGGSTGLMIYDFFSDGTLSGVWTVPGMGGVGSEVLTPM
jgi:hypothetical protein